MRTAGGEGAGGVEWLAYVLLAYRFVYISCLWLAYVFFAYRLCIIFQNQITLGLPGVQMVESAACIRVVSMPFLRLSGFHLLLEKSYLG